ncbi:hypothetical protein K8Q93_00495 [Candidatus Parcubacteria bacterium]|nr:hypothetical protein [Candidatus Parcubacteria bacterium]
MAIKLSASRLDLSNARLDNADLRGYAETQNALGNVSGATAIDLSLGTVVTATVTAATTFSITNIPSATQYVSFTLVLTNGGRFTTTWMSGTKWQNSVAPTLSVIGTDVLTLFTTDNGTTWRGSVAMPNSSSGSQLFSWGSHGGVGAVGQGLTTVNASSPVQLAGTWVRATGGRYDALALRTDGSLFAWGDNGNGQLGLGDIASRSSPTQVAGTWVAVSAGQYHTLGIKADGTLWGWGYNASGALGLSDTAKRSSPVQISSGVWTDVFGGSGRSHFINSSGELFGTGGNTTFGHLGLGDKVNRSSPVQIGGTWSSVACGVHLTMGVRSNGTLWGIGGYNALGAMGLGDAINRSSPVQVGADTSWSSVFSHNTSHHSLALRSNGALFSMGFGSQGALGHGDVVTRSSPTQLAGTWLSVGSGQYHHVASRTNGQMFAWGLNDTGQLGLSDLVNRSSPVQVTGAWGLMSGGRNNSLGLKQ